MELRPGFSSQGQDNEPCTPPVLRPKVPVSLITSYAQPVVKIPRTQLCVAIRSFLAASSLQQVFGPLLNSMRELQASDLNVVA